MLGFEVSINFSSFVLLENNVGLSYRATSPYRKAMHVVSDNILTVFI